MTSGDDMMIDLNSGKSNIYNINNNILYAHLLQLTVCEKALEIKKIKISYLRGGTGGTVGTMPCMS